MDLRVYFKDRTEKNLPIGQMWGLCETGINNDSQVFDLRNWMNCVAPITELEIAGEERFWWE